MKERRKKERELERKRKEERKIQRQRQRETEIERDKKRWKETDRKRQEGGEQEKRRVLQQIKGAAAFQNGAWRLQFQKIQFFIFRDSRHMARGLNARCRFFETRGDWLEFWKD